MRKSLEKIELLFRAWPIRPLPLAILLTLFQILVNFAIVIATARAVGRTLTPIMLIATLPSIALGFILSFSVLWSLKKLSEYKKSLKGISYWLGAILFGLAMALARFLAINDFTPEYWKEPISAVRIFVITALFYLTVHITLGVSSLRLEEQKNAAESAKASLEIQRGKLISAQEDVRRQIADFLHDRLQSDLVLLGMQMQKSSEKLNTEEKAIAHAYINEIERIRQFDVRSVSKQLAPELQGPSMRPALEDLADSYSKVMKIELGLKETGNLSKNQKLACYRIIEQALLNAAGHGKADLVAIDVRESDSEISICVRNNGLPLPDQPIAGAGFAIIEDWVSQSGGEWSLETEGQLTVLRVLLRP